MYAFAFGRGRLFIYKIKLERQVNKMKAVWSLVQGGFAAIGGVLGWFLGGVDGFLYALIAFVVLDYVTGVMVAIVRHEISSEIGARGIFKKMLIFILVGLAHMVDVYVLNDGEALRMAVAFFYLANEGLSIIENSVNLGLPVPEAFKKVFAQLTEKSNDTEGK
jgi:toxin secretion/phage lysis holin